MSGREYLFEKSGKGCKKGGPPMSVTHSFPQRPVAARLKWEAVRFGQGNIETVLCCIESFGNIGNEFLKSRRVL
jgi:hypothetical protein